MIFINKNLINIYNYFLKKPKKMTTPMYFLNTHEQHCYEGATENRFVGAAAIPDSRQCAGPGIRNVGGVVGQCSSIGYTQNKGHVIV